MPGHKLGRTTEDIRRELSALLRELKDPRTQNMLLSIVRVEVTNDLSYCTVYVSAMEGLDRAKTAVQGLRSASGFLRRELGRRLQLRHVPELIFKATDSIGRRDSPPPPFAQAGSKQHPCGAEPAPQAKTKEECA